MNTHNICFCQEIRKILWIPLLSVAMQINIALVMRTIKEILIFYFSWEMPGQQSTYVCFLGIKKNINTFSAEQSVLFGAMCQVISSF